MPKPSLAAIFAFEPPWRPPALKNLPPADPKVLEGVERAHVGFRRFMLFVKAKEERNNAVIRAGTYMMGGFGAAPAVTARVLASMITAIATGYATKHEKKVAFVVNLYGYPPPEQPHANPRITCSFLIDGRPDEEDDDEESEEGEAEEDGEGEDEDEDAEEGEDEDEDDAEDEAEDDEENEDDESNDAEDREAEEIVSSPDPPDSWYQGPSNPADTAQRPRPNVPYGPGARSQFAQPLRHVTENEWSTAFPPGAAPAPVTPASLGAMTQPNQSMAAYQQGMHPASAMFMHHAGGMFAESRFQMEWFRMDNERQAARSEKMIDKFLEVSQLRREDYERQAQENREAHVARQDAMKKEFDMLQAILDWRTKLLEAEFEKRDITRDAAQKLQMNQPSVLQIASMFAPMLPGFIGQIAHYIKGRSGEPPPLVTPDTLQFLSSMMGGGQMPPPGMMDPNAPPPGFIPPGGGTVYQMGAMPPGMQPGMPPGMQPGMPSNGAPPMASPMMGSPFGVPSSSPPIPTPTPDFVPEPVDPRATFGAEPAAPPNGSPAPSNSSFGSDSSSSPAPASGNGAKPASPFAWSAPQPTAPPPAPEPVPSNGQPQQAELHARFAAGPLSAMCWMLQRMTTETTAQKIRSGATQAWDLICQAAASPDDQTALPALLELGQLFDSPQGFVAILPHLDSERAALLCDLRSSILGMIAQAQAAMMGQGPWGMPQGAQGPMGMPAGPGPAPQPYMMPAQGSPAPPLGIVMAQPGAAQGIPITFASPPAPMAQHDATRVAEVITPEVIDVADTSPPEQEDGSSALSEDDDDEVSPVDLSTAERGHRKQRRSKKRKRRGY